MSNCPTCDPQYQYETLARWMNENGFILGRYGDVFIEGQPPGLHVEYDADELQWVVKKDEW